jgi:hypothetical protein
MVMAVGMKLVPAIMKLPNQPIELVKMGTEIHTHPHNQDLLTVYVAEGYKKKAKRWKKSGLKEVNIPRDHIIKLPGSFETDMFGKTEPKLICCLPHLCHSEIMRQKETLKESLILAEKEKDKAVNHLVNFLTAIQNTGTHSEKVLAIQSEYEGIMKGMGMMKDEKQK